MSNIDTSSWREFKLLDLFDVKTTTGIDKNKVIFDDTGEYDFIGRTPIGWGVQGKVKKLSFDPNPKNTFSLIQVGESVALWRENEWYASQNLFILIPKYNEIFNSFIFFQAVINKVMEKYGKDYNSYPTLNSLKEEMILLPVKEEDIPDWDYMAERIKELEAERIKELEAYLVATGLDDYELTEEDKQVLVEQVRWKEFKIGDLFEKQNLKWIGNRKFNKLLDVSKECNLEFSLPLANAKHGDNGIMYYGRPNDWEFTDMCLDIVNDGAISAGDVYPQPQNTSVLYNAYLIKPCYNALSQELLIFMACCLEKNIKRLYSYDNKATWEKVKNNVFELPVKDSGQPDWDYMERYICATEKLIIADAVKWKDRQIATTKQIVDKSIA